MMEVVILTISSAANDENFIKTMTFPLQSNDTKPLPESIVTNY